MKQNQRNAILCFLAAMPLCASAQVFSWETDTEGWAAGGSNSVATSTTGATNGSQTLAVTMPNSNMWWNAAANVNLSSAQLLAVFANATELKIDVTYPNPGFTSWGGNGAVELIIQGENVGWTGLATRDVNLDGGPQTLTFPLTVAQAASMASSSWGQIILRTAYGSGGTTSNTATMYFDNFTHTVVVDPAPTSHLYWKGDVDDQWDSLNWTTDSAGTNPGGALPTDGTSGIAFATAGAINLTNDLGADQHVKSIVVNAGIGPVTIGGSNNLTVGSNGIWLAETALSFAIDTTGEVVLGANQVWRNKSPNTMFVSSEISGIGVLTKSGVGSLNLSGSNTHTGGTIIEQGSLIIENANALGPNNTALTVNGGSLDLNGYNISLGSLSGLTGGVIKNTSSTPTTLTLDVAAGCAYTCQVNHVADAGAISLVKKGASTVTSYGGGSFTGNVSIEDGTFVANNWVFSVPNWSSFGNCQLAGRTITVTSPGALSFATNSVFGNNAADTSLLPEIIINESTLNSTRYNQVGAIILNSATLNHSSSDTGDYAGFQFKGRIKVIGTAGASTITGNGKGNHLSSNTVFDVTDVSGDTQEDLIVSTPLINQSGDFANAAGGLTKTGPGKMVLSAMNTYSGATIVSEGILVLDFASLNDNSTVEIATGATLELTHSDTDTVAALMLGGISQPDGDYGAIGSEAEHETAFITGSGIIHVGVVDPFAVWIANYPSLTGPATARDADPDGDGQSNLFEFAFNSKPNDANSTSKTHSSVTALSGEKALVLTLPVRVGAVFSGTAPATSSLTEEMIDYQISGSNGLTTFDQAVSEVAPALTSGLPTLDVGWEYRTFRLNGNVAGNTPRGPRGFLRASVVDQAP